MPDYMSPNTAAVHIFDSDAGEHSDLEHMLNAPTNTPTSRTLVSQDRGNGAMRCRGTDIKLTVY